MVLAWQKLVHGKDLRGHGGFTSSSGEVYSENSVLLTASQPGVRKRMRWCTTTHREFGLSSEHVSVFLTADNTVITIFESSGEDVLQQVMHHLDSPRTILRTSNDPSMLIHAVVDAIVDLAVPIERTITEAFTELENTVLRSPDVGQSKELYRLRSALIVLMDDIAAIGTVVKSLCDHRQAPSLPVPEEELGVAEKDALVPISPLAQVYLQDVNDHIEMLAKSTQRGVHSAENLTSLIFSTIAAGQNASLQRLTIVSIFFLPLTFLTGYFGMNFDPMPVVNNNSDQFFWYIAGPVMLGTLLILGPRPRRWSFFARRSRRDRRQ